MNVNSGSQNVNFQAKLYFQDMAGEIKPYKRRLANISKKFEEKTAKYPNDKIVIKDNANGGIFLETFIKNNEEGGNFSRKGLAQLFKLSDEEIANKFSKLHKMSNKADEIMQRAYKFYDSLSKGVESKGLELKDEKFWDFITSAQSAVRQSVVAKDKILGNPEYFNGYIM